MNVFTWNLKQHKTEYPSSWGNNKEIFFTKSRKMSSLHLLVDARCDICRYELCMPRFQINGNALHNGRARAWIQRTVGWPLEIRECSSAVQFFLCIFFFLFLSLSVEFGLLRLGVNSHSNANNHIKWNFSSIFFFHSSFLLCFALVQLNLSGLLYFSGTLQLMWPPAMPRTSGEWMPRALTRMHWTAL